MKKTFIHLIYTTVMVVLLTACKKDSIQNPPQDAPNMYQEWLSLNGGSYKNGTTTIALSKTEQQTAILNWEKATEYKWRGHSYVEIPFELNNQQKITIDDVSFISLNLVIRKKSAIDWEGAIRTGHHYISAKNEGGEDIIRQVEIYQTFDGKVINSWEKKEGSRTAEPIYILPSQKGTAPKINCTVEYEVLYFSSCSSTPNPGNEATSILNCTTTEVNTPIYSCNDDGAPGDDILPYPPGQEPNVMSIRTWNQTVVNVKPFVLFPGLSCSIISQWAGTSLSVVGSGGISKLNTIISNDGGSYHGNPGIKSEYVGRLLNFSNTRSSVINMDFFPIKVTQLPTVGGIQLTPDQLMEYIRKNINSFIDSSVAVFTPYNSGTTNDSILWNSANPLNAVLSIDVPGADNAYAIVHNYTSSKLSLTTMHDPRFGNHGVVGNRDISYVQNPDSSYTFYTWGLHRITEWLNETLYYIVVNDAASFSLSHSDVIWTSFRMNLHNFINLNNGVASAMPIETYRPNWSVVREVIEEIELSGDVLNFTCNP